MEEPVTHISVFKKEEKNLADPISLHTNIRDGIVDDHQVGETERLKVISTPIKISNQNSNPEFLQYSDKINTFSSALEKGHLKNKLLAESPLFSNSMKLRKSELRLKKNGEANGFQKSIEHIQDFYATHEKNEISLPDMVKELYFRGDDLYHNSEGHKLIVPALQVVTGTDNWGSTDNPGQLDKFYQNNCQGKFTASYNSCGETDYLLLSRPSFATKIHQLAEAKIKLFDILSNGEIAPIHAQLSSEWANQSAQFPSDWSKEETIIHKDLVSQNGFLNPESHLELNYLSENHFESTSNKETFENKIHQDIDQTHQYAKEVLYAQ
ncbi:MAG: hypothetical protein EP326_02500 [Deltaproteobacteria bacterium]|nr:MAG: hypothetical protein EP326_02500 [Deltaproteobacteria bacterium]